MKKTHKYHKQTMIRVYMNSMTSCRFLVTIVEKNSCSYFVNDRWLYDGHTYVCMYERACYWLKQYMYIQQCIVVIGPFTGKDVTW